MFSHTKNTYTQEYYAHLSRSKRLYSSVGSCMYVAVCQWSKWSTKKIVFRFYNSKTRTTVLILEEPLPFTQPIYKAATSMVV